MIPLEFLVVWQMPLCGGRPTPSAEPL